MKRFRLALALAAPLSFALSPASAQLDPFFEAKAKAAAQGVVLNEPISVAYSGQSSIGQVAVVPLASGRKALIWDAAGATPGTSAISIRTFDANGAPEASSVMTISSGDGVDLHDVDAVAVEGGFQATWVERIGPASAIHFGRFDANGMPLSVSPAPDGKITNPKLGPVHEPAIGRFGPDPSGRAIIAWRGQDRIMAQRLFPTGQLYGPAVELSAQAGGEQTRPDIAHLKDKRSVVVWTKDRSEVRARLIGAPDDPPTPEIAVYAGGAGAVREAAVLALKNGFVVFWMHDNVAPNRRVLFARRYGPTGIAIGEAFQVSDHDIANAATAPSGPARFDEKTRGTALDDGGFFLVWCAFTPDCGHVVGRRFDADASPMGETFAISEPTGAFGRPVVALVAPERAAVVWPARTSGGPHTSIRMRHISFNPAPRDRADCEFDDCDGKAWCPRMVRIAKGAFRMGSRPYDQVGPMPGQPLREVSVPAFAVGKNEVTRAEWRACVEGGGCKSNPQVGDFDPNGEDGRRPVVNVSWSDAQEYVDWLSAATSENYRLLSEAEWEYAARAGGATTFGFGDTLSAAQAIVGSGPLKLVGSYRANAFGLKDMHGNVSEWVADCANDSHAGAPANAAPRTDGDCNRRVRRGGSFKTPPQEAASSGRTHSPLSERRDDVGFRIARRVQ